MIVLRVLTLVREEAPMIAAGCVVALREGCAGCAGCVNAVPADSVDDWRDYQALRHGLPSRIACRLREENHPAFVVKKLLWTLECPASCVASCVRAVPADSVDDWRDYQTLRLGLPSRIACRLRE